ncbi:gas vesicle protein [Caldicoprobacter guelmensis]|uniref:YtxH domain-containing protein n=1 Tax=Caldicoprobacter guelmensis TaxID=1170224 RepID=UPI00195B92B7|nr:YtxH domain-containing protein [Caldicoprobacter guelmensis]MBM7581366.1 gas vesicle protein [Caldicoprobacter guelmensis]
MNKYLRGFIAGSMVGIAASMLFMPGKDNEMKRKFWGSSKNIMDNASQIMANMLSEMKERK